VDAIVDLFSSAPDFRIVHSSAAAARLDAALRFLAELPPATEALVVAASRGAADDLVRKFAFTRGATFGLHRFSFTQLAAHAAAAALAAGGRAPGTLLGAQAVAARATFDADRRSALTWFAPVATTPGFPKALARTLDELRLAGVRAGALSSLLPGGADLAALFDRFERQFVAAAAADRAALFDTAAAALRGRPAFWPARPLILLDVPIDSRGELAFVDALVAASSRILATTPAGDARALDRLRALGGEVQALEERAVADDLASLRRHLFSGEPPPARQETGELRFFSAPGEGRECVEIARSIFDEARRGVRFDEMAIFLRSPAQYLGLLEHALRRAGVPAWFDRGVRKPDPAGRAFLALLGCAVERLSARRFAEYLSLGQVPLLDPSGAPPAGPPAEWVPPSDEIFAALAQEEEERSGSAGLQPRPEQTATADQAALLAGTLRAPWKWEHLLVEAAVIGGRDRWQRRLDGLEREYELKLAELIRDEPDSPRRARLEHDRDDLGHLRAFALPIIDLLAAWPATATWGEWLDRLERLAPRVLRQPTRVLRLLADLRPMAAIGPVALDEVSAVLADRLRQLEVEPPSRRYGRVFIGSPHQARGRAFRIVFVPGLAERLFPERPREDPMLLDDVRRALGAGLPVQEDRSQTERLLLRLATGAATDRLYVSYPRLELAESRPRVPSFYALDVKRAVTGRVPAHEDLQHEAAEEVRATLAWPAPPDPSRAVDDLEHDLAVLRPLLEHRDSTAVRGRAHYLLRLNENLRRSITSRWRRAKGPWSAADGIARITDRTRESLQAQRLVSRPYSVSALQRFATCPYQFLLAAIHRLEPRERPEPLQRMDALTRGSLFHAAQAAFFRRLADRGRLPLTMTDLDEALANLDVALAQMAEEYREKLAPAIDRVWHDDVAGVRRDLRIWASRLAETDGWTPFLFEFSFGLPELGGRDPRSVPDPVRIDGRFLLRGSVDLVERRAGARQAPGGAAGELRVTDHKTGRNRTAPGLVIGGGTVLQPVIYALAVEAAAGERVASGRLYFCTAAGGFAEREIVLSDANRRLGIEVLEIIDRAVELGTLVPAPMDRACTWCDFRSVCGPHEEERARRKSAGLLADLQHLRSRP
jgi:ATP-dependent helicase/nuclease subunit B